MAMLRACLIGYGSMGKQHARVLKSLEHVNLVSVVEPDFQVIRDLRGPAILRRVNEICAGSIDMAVVAAPAALHEEVGLFLAEQGVPTLIEKPLSTRYESARRLVEAFRDAECIACVGHVERYNPALRSLRERIQGGELGSIFQILTRRQGPKRVRTSDVGVSTDLGTHDFDVTRWVAGEAYASLFAHSVQTDSRGNEDLVAVLGMLRDGTRVSHLASRISSFKERVTIVSGERGALVADTLTADLTFYGIGRATVEWDVVANLRGTSEGDVVRFGIPKVEPLREELVAFRDMVLGRDSEIVMLADGLAAVEVAEAVVASATTGRVVEIRPSVD